MTNQFLKVKEYLIELNYEITHENEADGIFVIDSETDGIKNLVICCADPLLIMEQFIFEVQEESVEVYKNLLQKNQDIVHGAFVLDETGRKVIFRDTLQIENLDLNELEGSLNSLSLLLIQFVVVCCFR